MCQRALLLVSMSFTCLLSTTLPFQFEIVKKPALLKGGSAEVYPAWATALAGSNRWKLRLHQWMLGLHPTPVASLFQLGGEAQIRWREAIYITAFSSSTRWRGSYEVEEDPISKHPVWCRLLFMPPPVRALHKAHSRSRTSSRVSWAHIQNLLLPPFKMKFRRNVLVQQEGRCWRRKDGLFLHRSICHHLSSFL